MHGDAVRQLEVIHIAALIDGLAFVVKDDGNRLVLRVNFAHKADVAVKDALPLFPAKHALAPPLDLVVVARLHHLVSLAEDGIAARALLLARGGRIEARLKQHVERPHAAIPLLCRGEHLNLPHGLHTKEARQAGGAQLHDARGRVRRGGRALKEEVATLRVQAGRFAAVDAVRVVDNHALFILTEDFCQPHGGHHAAVEDVPQHIARAHARELVRVADHNQPRARHERAQHGAHQEDVHHRHLVDNQRV